MKKYVGDKIVGSSTDTKPTNIGIGAIFYETDTLKSFILTSNGWESMASNLSDLNDVDNTNKATNKILQVRADGKHEYVTMPDPTVQRQITGIFQSKGLRLLDVETSCIVGYPCEITGWKIINSTNKNTIIQIDVYKNDVKISDEPIKLLIQTSNEGLPTNWDTEIEKGDIIKFKVSLSGANTEDAEITTCLFVNG